MKVHRNAGDIEKRNEKNIEKQLTQRMLCNIITQCDVVRIYLSQ